MNITKQDPRTRWFRFASTALVLVIGASLSGCTALMMRETADTLPSRTLVEASSASSCAVVLLPGRFSGPDEFEAQGFADEVRERDLDMKVVATDAHLGYYRERSIVDRLHEDVVAPLREEGRPVWLVGVSLGGLGNLIYSRVYGEEVEGLVLLGPFLGRKDLAAQIEQAGGPGKWRPATQPAEDTVEGLWLWIAEAFAEGPPMEVRLGYGHKDRFIEGTRIFESLLDEENVRVGQGGHDWPVWRQLWGEMLDEGLICGNGG